MCIWYNNKSKYESEKEYWMQSLNVQKVLKDKIAAYLACFTVGLFPAKLGIPESCIKKSEFSSEFFICHWS